MKKKKGQAGIEPKSSANYIILNELISLPNDKTCPKIAILKIAK